jgi:murein DD-endopeptidase MepM/ murein hydrolase activator NlpD
VAGGIALLFLASLSIVTTQPAEARNWTAQISATRASQIYYEGAMRAADRQIKSTKRAQKQTKRKIKKGRATLARVKARRAALGARYRQTQDRYVTARRAYQASQVALAVDDASAILALTVLASIDDAVAPLATADEAAGPPTPADADRADMGFLASTPGAQRVAAEAGPTEADVAQLKKQAKKHKRSFKKIKKKVRRVARTKRARTRQLSALKRQYRAAISRREGAEAALGGRILAMSSLAQRRVSKKTNVRPGQNSGFAWPTRGRISQSYGCTGFYLSPRRGSCAHFHDGLDIVSYRGSPIRSAAIGVVSYIGWNPWDQHGRAFMIVVAHPGGYETLYGHVLPTRRVRVGQLVKKGEVIGYMGNTGRSTGAHLHLEMRRGRTTINPLAFL